MCPNWVSSRHAVRVLRFFGDDQNGTSNLKANRRKGDTPADHGGASKIAGLGCTLALILAGLTAVATQIARDARAVPVQGPNLAPNPEFTTGNGPNPDGWEPFLDGTSGVSFVWTQAVGRTSPGSVGVTATSQTCCSP